jgi:glycosyltransferase involved in cell wall biosynthesis
LEVPATRFSVVITCHNQRDFIREAVDSALAQSHPRNEIIVVDDASTDGSLETLQQYGNEIRLVSFSKSLGASEARNHGAACARGEYLVFLDGDDLLMPWALDVYERIIGARDAKIIQAQCTWFNGKVPQLREEDLPRNIDFVAYDHLLAKDRPFGYSASTLIVDRQTLQHAGGWTPGIFHLDLIDLALKLGSSGRTVLICSPPTVFYRVHQANSIHAVPPFLQMAHTLMKKERAEEYPGGRKQRFERCAQLGGTAAFWVKRAFNAGLFKDALVLAVSALPMIIAAIVRRFLVLTKGRRPVERLSLQSPNPGLSPQRTESSGS